MRFNHWVYLFSSVSAFVAGPALSAEVLTLQGAIKQTIVTNPGVGEAAANRRATESEMRQVQSTLLPQVKLEGRFGAEKFHNGGVLNPVNDGRWRNGDQYTVVVRQLVFDGFTSVNEIWRQAARVDAAAMRTYERTELLALDAAEAYIDVVRYIRLVSLAERNVQAHREIAGNVNSRYSGGRAGEGDLQQTKERVAASEAVARPVPPEPRRSACQVPQGCRPRAAQSALARPSSGAPDHQGQVARRRAALQPDHPRRAVRCRRRQIRFQGDRRRIRAERRARRPRDIGLQLRQQHRPPRGILRQGRGQLGRVPRRPGRVAP